MHHLLLILFSLALACSTSVFAERPRPFSLGVVVPLTGPMASIGTSIQAAVRHAVKEQNADVILTFEDDQFQPKLTVSAVRKLIAKDRIDALIVFGSPTSLSVVDELERNKLPTISVAIHERITKDKEYIFRVFSSAADLAEISAAEAVKRNYSRLALVSNLTDGLLSIMSKFTAQYPKDRIVSSQEISPSETDLRPYVTRALKDNPDALFLMLLPHHLGAFVTQLAHYGYKGAVFNAVSMANSSVLKVVTPLLKNGWYVMIDAEKVASTIQTIEQTSGLEFETEGIFGYEAARLFLSVKDEKDLAIALREKKQFQSVLGEISPTGQDYFMPVAVNTLHHEARK